MNALELIGKVAARALSRMLREGERDANSTARFLLDRLKAEEVAHICLSIHTDETLRQSFEIHIPKSLVSLDMAYKYQLPETYLTEEKATFWRNAACHKDALLIANTSDDQGQSLKELTTINAEMLKGYAEIWCQIASEDLPLTQAHLKQWEQALKGLESTIPCSLMQFATYVLETRNRLLQKQQLVNALGWALPALRTPRDSNLFASIPNTKLAHKAEWQKRFQQTKQQRTCFLEKQTPKREYLDDDDLRKRFDEYKDRIDASAHSVIESFLQAQPGWSEASQALSEFEWEDQCIGLLFVLKASHSHLADHTLDFYKDEYPDTLTSDEVDYLYLFKKRGKERDPLDQDRDFYEKHRQEMALKPSLKSKWDKFIYGAPIDCNDFLVGLLMAVSRLIEQNSDARGTKHFTVSTQKDGARSKWLDINTDAALYFCTRYRGLPNLLGSTFNWNVHHLFKYDQFIQTEKEKANKGSKKPYKRNASVSKKANEIKLSVRMDYHSGGSQQYAEVQLVWHFSPLAIGSKLEGDLSRLVSHPFIHEPLYLESVSSKGVLQTLSLDNTGTLQAVYRQERGTLIPSYLKSKDQKITFEKHLHDSQSQLGDNAYQKIKGAWDDFSATYTEALKSWYEQGISQPVLIEQAQKFSHLLDVLSNYAADDTSREKLWEPLFRLGHHQVIDKPLGIIAPWHPLRLAAMMVKDQQVAQLFKQLSQADLISFSDARLFFAERTHELQHPYYPEAAVHFSSPPELVVATETLYDYSLMESPVIHNDHLEESHEDPTTVSRRIKDVVARYLELLPHEQSSLNLLLYNCDNALLPQTAIRQLSEVYADSNVICQLMLRHHNRKKLANLYRNLIESTSQDDNSIIMSEYSLDFMSRFRIGILAESPATKPHFEKPVDIVFLQDVISRQATLEWLPIQQSYSPSLEEHIPARWSKRRPMPKGEKKGTHYLVCPVQPQEGKQYLQSLAHLIRRISTPINNNQTESLIPSRQIYLEDRKIRDTIDDVHRLGEWVVNYDDLLDRRQLKNLGLQVIRFQQRRTQGRNLLISSNASLSLLKVLVRRRLDDLSLQLAAQELDGLVEKFIEEANLVSGDLVLRAAKRGIFSKELIGVVLSLALLRAEIGSEQPMGIYFLDDYASWLGQKEQRIADLLVLNPRGEGESRCLHVFVSEAKYVETSGLDSARKSSQNQLNDTLTRISQALLSEEHCIDRELWLSRFGELLLEGMGVQPSGLDFSLEAEKWRTDLMQGKIPIKLYGYSHVFISGPSDLDTESQQLPNPRNKNAIQEIFSRNSVRDLVKWYAKDEYDKILRHRKGLGIHKSFDTIRKVKPLSNASSESEAHAHIPHRNEPVADTKQDAYVPQENRVILDIPSPKPEILSSGHNWPPSYLLGWFKREASPQTEEEHKLAEDIAKRLSHALYGYDLPAKVLETRLTPNSVLVKFQGSDQLKLSDIEKKQSQLLTTHSLRIIYLAAQPGVLVVAIERSQRQKLSLVDSWLQRSLNRSDSGMNMSLLVGIKELDGELLYLNVESEFANLQQHAPHTLIAGATGSGKSVLLQNLILDIALTNSPSLAKIHLIDPKGVDYQHLEPLPHLGKGIIYEQEEAAQLLHELVDEMESRYKRFRDFRVNKLSDYNRIAPDDQKIPAIWLIHDEFADWMMIEEYKNEVINSVKRLGVKARAAGIHLVFAAQRPDASVLPPQLRDNLGNRLILKVESEGTSKIALNQEGAEKLLGKGHLAARLSGEPDLIYGQVPFLTMQQMEELVALVRAHYV
jgi:S-DNA-T family DNA segregation ATPase FtsK/SpoIIIE